MSPQRLSRGEALGGGLCTWCGKKVGDFRDSLSRTEYRISGFCQKCQDETFDKKGEQVMPLIEIEIEVWCSCGEGLCRQSEDAGNRGRPGIVVEPCQNCLNAAEEKGYDRGYQDGQPD